MSVSTVATIKDAQQSAKEWLFEHAAPLWSSAGFCTDGLFAERLTIDGAQVAMKRRLRVQARQIYAFCTIGKLGWDGPWRQVVESSLDILLNRGRREDGLFAHLFDEDGNVVDSRIDLYDHAFGLFALAHAGHALQRPDLFDIAEDIQNILDEKWARPQGGLWEGELTPSPPYRQNPHMHMFESALAHYRFSGRERWRVMKDRLGELFRDRFRDADSGAVTEYFDRDWNKVEGPDGEIVEPGHCLEWAWLFEVGFNGGEGVDISDGLVGFARRHGLSESRGVAINEVWLNGTVKDGGARLWPQTERLKAAVARYNRTREDSEANEIVAAFNGLLLYLDTPARGTWYDKLNEDGSWVAEDSPASSFYHIVCAIAELLALEVPDPVKVEEESALEIAAPIILSGQVSAEEPAKLDSCIFFGEVEVGAFTYFSPGSQASNADIGRYCSIGPDVLIGPGEHPLDMVTTHPIASDPSGMSAGMLNWQAYTRTAINVELTNEKADERTILEHDVWVGARAIIRKGVRIGMGAVIGAGAVVTKDVPPYAVAVGVPAKVTRMRFDAPVVEKLLASKWWESDLSQLEVRDFANPIKFMDDVKEADLPKLSPRTKTYKS